MFLFLLALLLIIAQSCPEQLEYRRDAVLQGEFWRIISGHFVHRNWLHSGLNFTGTVLLAVMFKNQHSEKIWLLFIFSLNLLLGLALLAFCPDLIAYRGLSGSLHGVLAFALLTELANGKKFYLLVLLVFGAKIIQESESLYYSPMIDDFVIAEAHFFGFVIAVLLYLAIGMKKRVADSRQGENPC